MVVLCPMCSSKEITKTQERGKDGSYILCTCKKCGASFPKHMGMEISV